LGRPFFQPADGGPRIPFYPLSPEINLSQKRLGTGVPQLGRFPGPLGGRQGILSEPDSPEVFLGYHELGQKVAVFGLRQEFLRPSVDTLGRPGRFQLFQEGLGSRDALFRRQGQEMQGPGDIGRHYFIVRIQITQKHLGVAIAFGGGFLQKRQPSWNILLSPFAVGQHSPQMGLGFGYAPAGRKGQPLYGLAVIPGRALAQAEANTRLGLGPGLPLLGGL
jgi:hypothetical protein